ncbi:MAG: DUF5336 domain-containing protein [Haloechinothrix sp.]
MSFPSGGFPAQGPQSQPPQQGQGTQYLPPAAPQAPKQETSRGGSISLGVILPLAVTLLGLLAYFLSFSDSVGFGGGFLSFDDPVQFMLLAGLLAALHVLPKGPTLLPVIVLLSVLGFFIVLSGVVEGPSVPGAVIFLLILSIFQMLVALAALLSDYGVLKLPQPKQQPAYGQPAQFGQPGQYGQQPPAGPVGHPGQFGGAPGPAQPQQPQPPAGQGPMPQQTQYASQQGQFYQQPPNYGQEQPPQKPESER